MVQTKDVFLRAYTRSDNSALCSAPPPIRGGICSFSSVGGCMPPAQRDMNN